MARAVNTRGHIMTLSNAASQPVEDVAAARRGPVWFPLYRDPDWSRTLAMIKRAEAAGSPVLAWTIDSQGGGKRIVHARARRRDRAFCGTCHTLNPDDRGLALPGLGSTINPDGKPMTTTPPLGPPRLDGRIATWRRRRAPLHLRPRRLRATRRRDRARHPGQRAADGAR